MLLNYTVRNWKSFFTEESIRLMGSDTDPFASRLSVSGNGERILPIGVVYGGPNSGKSNLYKSLLFVRDFIFQTLTIPHMKIPVESYNNSYGYGGTSSFSFEFLAEETIYNFSFSVDNDEIVKESLGLGPEGDENFLYKRDGSFIDFNESNLSRMGLSMSDRKSIIKNVSSKRLVLTQMRVTEINGYRPIYDWFVANLRFPIGRLDQVRFGSRGVIIMDDATDLLHPYESWDIISKYLLECTPKSRSQLLLFTNDLILMDLGLLRQDEMMIINREKGISHIYSFNDYSLNINKLVTVRRDYIRERLKGKTQYKGDLFKDLFHY